MVTVKDIARHAGVSIGTVDRVLHGRGRVAPETKQRVVDAIEDLDYKPNVHARNLSKGRTYQIDIISPHPEMDGGYWKLPLAGATKALEQFATSNVQVSEHWFDRQDEASFLRVFDTGERTPDGILIAPVVSSSVQTKLLGTISPESTTIVTFDSRLSIDIEACFVGQDPVEGGRTAGRLSQLLRDRREAVASVTLGRTDKHLLDRARGFREYWSDHATGQDSPRVIEIMLDHVDADTARSEVSQELRTCLDSIGAIFVTNAASDLVIQAIRELEPDRHIPIIGYDLLRQNARLLASGEIDAVISQKPEQQGFEAMNMLLQRVLYGKSLSTEMDMLMPVEIILRENLPGFIASRGVVSP